MKNICLKDYPHVENIVINGIEYINSAFIKLVTNNEQTNADAAAQKKSNVIQFKKKKQS